MNSLVTVSQLNKNARANCEKCFNELKELVEVDVGSICSNGDEYDKKGKSSKDVLNYPGYWQKGVWNKRIKSIVEKKCDKVKCNKWKKLYMSYVFWIFGFCVLYVNF